LQFCRPIGFVKIVNPGNLHPASGAGTVPAVRDERARGAGDGDSTGFATFRCDRNRAGTRDFLAVRYCESVALIRVMLIFTRGHNDARHAKKLTPGIDRLL
jgi:hypothetical protein